MDNEEIEKNNEESLVEDGVIESEVDDDSFTYKIDNNYSNNNINFSF